MIKKIKYLLILVFLLSFINITFADGFGTGSINNCLETRCINERIDELIKVNKILQIKNKELSDKYNGFNSSLDYYLKVLDEGKNITNEKKEAYGIALNQLRFWVIIFGAILSVILIIFGLYKGNKIFKIEEDFKNKIDDFKKTSEKELSSYRKYITIIDEKIITAGIITKFDENKDEFKSEFKSYINDIVNNTVNEYINKESEDNKEYINNLFEDSKDLIERRNISNSSRSMSDEVDDAELLDSIDGIS